MKLLSALFAAVLVASLGVPALAAADDRVALVGLADLSRDDRVRLRLSVGGKRVDGTVETAGADEVVVRPKDPGQPLLHVSPQQIAKLDVAWGRRSHWCTGAVIGFLPGAVFGGAVAVALGSEGGGASTDELLGFGLAGGAVTGALGALIGLAVRTDRWVPVATGRPRVALGLAPTKGGFQANLSLRF